MLDASYQGVKRLFVLAYNNGDANRVTVDSHHYATGSLLGFAYFEKNYRLIAADLSEQKALDADSRAIQQIIFTGKASGDVMVYYILEQSKETILQFCKGTTKIL